MIRRMWCMIRTELEYHKVMLAVCYSLLTLLVLFLGLREHNPSSRISVGYTLNEELSFLLLILIGGHAFITYRMTAVQKGERRLRFLLPLPVNRTEIGLARIGMILVLHFFTALLMFLWVFLVLDEREFSFHWTMRNWDLILLELQVMGSILTLLTVSVCLSLFILLLESRTTRPLLHTIVWVLILIPFLATIFMAAGLPVSFMPYELTSRGGFRLHARGISMTPLLPLIALAAAALACMYQDRIRRQTSFQG